MKEYFAEVEDTTTVPALESLEELSSEIDEGHDDADLAACAVSELDALNESLEELNKNEELTPMQVSVVLGSVPGVERLNVASMEAIDEDPRAALTTSMESVADGIKKILKAIKDATVRVMKAMGEFLKNLFMGAKSMRKKLAKLKSKISAGAMPKDKRVTVRNGAAIEYKRDLSPRSIVQGAEALSIDSELMLENYAPAVTKAIDEHIGRLTDMSDSDFERTHEDVVKKAERFAKNNTAAFVLPGGYLRNIQAISAHQAAGLQLPTPKYTRSPSKTHDDMEAEAPNGKDLLAIIDSLDKVFARVESKKKVISDINDKRREWTRIMDDWVSRTDDNVPVAGTNVGLRYRIAKVRSWFTLDKPVKSAASLYWKCGQSLLKYVEVGAANLA